MARDCGVLCILTYKCASRHSGLQFGRIETSKIVPRLWCFVHFDLQMCFAPHWRAILPDRNLAKLVRDCGVLCILTCKCASRHSGVQFFDIRTSKSAPTPFFTSKCAFRHSGVPFFTCLLNSYLRTRRFSEATSWTSGSTNH